MKFKFLIVILFFKGSFLFSQNEYQKSIDSLQAIINEETIDSNKIKHYIELCYLYEESDMTKFNVCNEQLLHILQKTKSTKNYGFYYWNKAVICYEINNQRQAITYAAKACDVFYKNKDWDNYIYYATEYAYFLYINDEIEKAIAVLDKALIKAINTKSKYIGTVYISISNLYNHISDYTAALKSAKKALAVEKASTANADIYYLMSTIYNGLENYKSALEYIELAKKYSYSSYFFVTCEMVRATILYNMQHYLKAVAVGLDCMEFHQKKRYMPEYYTSLATIADCYFKLKNYQLANVYIDEALKNNFEGRMKQIELKSRKAKICLALNDTKTSKKYINNALSALKDNDYFKQRIEVYDIKAKLEETLGNYKTALHYTNKIVAIKETNIANFNKNKVDQLQVDLDLTQKNNRIKNLQIAQLKKQVEIKTKDDYLLFALFAMSFLVGLVLFYVYNNRLVKNRNRLINISNSKLANERDISQKSLLEKETLLKEIHHRVKNNMQMVISLLKIQSRDTKKISIEDFITISENRIRSMALIHEYLYESDNISFVNFEEYVKRLASSIKSSFLGLEIQLETEIQTANFDIETSISLGLIINELVINAYKHAFVGIENGLIKIKLVHANDFYQLTIQDNGIGIAVSKEKGNTTGLKIVKLLVAQISGALTIINDSGTTFVIQFKKKIILPHYE